MSNTKIFKEIFFISRLKDNAKINPIQDLPITRSEENLLPKGSVILSDEVVRLGNESVNLTKHKYRLIKVQDPTGKILTFATNVMRYLSEEITWLYKRRWDIELFFKWIKQHCKIKTLIGYSENAVRLQMITGIITYLLLRLTWHEVPRIKSLIMLKQKIENLCLCVVLREYSFESILNNKTW